MRIISVFLSRRWLFATLLALAAVAVMGRLGIWQLDRLEARREFNARVIEQQEKPRLIVDAESVELDLYSMEYRDVVVRGHYLPEDEIVVRNQNWQGKLGVQLFTPLLIAGTDQVILVQRGWIPAEQADPESRIRFREEGEVAVNGVLRRAETDFSLQLRPDPTLDSAGARLDAWNNLNLERIAMQIDSPLLPVYLRRIPDGQDSNAPFAQIPSLDLTEGPHLGYAGQWFLFAAVLALGYPVFVLKQEQGKISSSK